jgi:hypothetical protein
MVHPYVCAPELHPNIEPGNITLVRMKTLHMLLKSKEKLCGGISELTQVV